MQQQSQSSSLYHLTFSHLNNMITQASMPLLWFFLPPVWGYSMSFGQLFRADKHMIQFAMAQVIAGLAIISSTSHLGLDIRPWNRLGSFSQPSLWDAVKTLPQLMFVNMLSIPISTVLQHRFALESEPVGQKIAYVYVGSSMLWGTTLALIIIQKAIRQCQMSVQYWRSKELKTSSAQRVEDSQLARQSSNQQRRYPLRSNRTSSTQRVEDSQLARQSSNQQRRYPLRANRTDSAQRGGR